MDYEITVFTWKNEVEIIELYNELDAAAVY